MCFAEEAVRIAEDAGDAVLLADALDAQLLVSWGPDDLTERVRITRRLENTVSHVTDVEARMTARLWRLTTALECLDLPTAQRQLRELDALAEESAAPRVRFFAAARRGMYALLTGDHAAAARYRDTAVSCGDEAGEADALAIERTLSAGIARSTGDTEALAREAALHEEFGTREGIPLITAICAVLWLESGETDRAVALLHQLTARSLADIPRDVYWLVTATALTEVAAATGEGDVAAEGWRCSSRTPVGGWSTPVACCSSGWWTTTCSAPSSHWARPRRPRPGVLPPGRRISAWVPPGGRAGSGA